MGSVYAEFDMVILFFINFSIFLRIISCLLLGTYRKDPHGAGVVAIKQPRVPEVKAVAPYNRLTLIQSFR